MSICACTVCVGWLPYYAYTYGFYEGALNTSLRQYIKDVGIRGLNNNLDRRYFIIAGHLGYFVIARYLKPAWI